MITFLQRHRMKILCTMAWLSLSAALLTVFLMFKLQNTLLVWSFHHNFKSYAAIAVTPIILFLIFVVARATKDRLSILISLVLVIFFLYLAIILIQAREAGLPLSDSPELLPLMFRLICAITFTLPVVAWIVFPLRYYLSTRAGIREEKF